MIDDFSSGLSPCTCSRCGKRYPKRKGFFPLNYNPVNKALGYLHVCKDCVDEMYLAYLEECKDPRLAARQMCRKLDLYWSENIYVYAHKKGTGRTPMSAYIGRANAGSNVGKSYDDTLIKEGTLWNFEDQGKDVIASNNEKLKTLRGSSSPFDIIEDVTESSAQEDDSPIYLDEDIEITDDIVRFWGAGYPKSMYKELEQRRRYWVSRLPKDVELDIGTEALIRQMCSLELDINRDRIAGKNVDKSVTALNTLMGSANLKPTQKKDTVDDKFEKQPMGVWIKRFEDERPIPDVDPDLEDVDGIKKYILTWFYGHIGKMMGVKNSHTKLYDEAIEELRVERPEFDDESDDDLLYDVLSGENDG